MILKKGDEIRVIAPSRSMNILTKEQVETAKKRLEDEGFKVTFGKHINEAIEYFNCAPVDARLEDLHDAFKDKNVKCVLAVLGGYNVNQLLKKIDYDLIKNNPKIICGFSDITALLNAVYAKTGMTTFLGPIFSNFGMQKGFEYTMEYFNKVLCSNDEVEITSSPYYSDDKWYKDQENRHFIKSNGMKVINEGKCSGTIIGGNLCTLNLLQGTEFMPSLKDSVLFIEDDNETGDNFLVEFDRNLESLMQLEDFKYVEGIVFGLAQVDSKMTDEKWKLMIKLKEKLKDIPIIINANFGHTTPIFTLPIGGTCRIDASKNSLEIVIKK